jgi:GH25 family lysozyme M1 (1,4-beta-N-acetylmuramidase)
MPIVCIGNHHNKNNAIVDMGKWKTWQTVKHQQVSWHVFRKATHGALSYVQAVRDNVHESGSELSVAAYHNITWHGLKMD